jgi:ABC-type Na+ efflux pump permease subunit
MISKSLKLFVLLMLVGFSSCTITKKYHSFGYHIESKFSKNVSHKNIKPAVVTSRNLASNTVANEVVVSDDLDEAMALNQSTDVVKSGEVNLPLFSTTVTANRGLSNQMNECVKSKINRNAEKSGIQKAVVSAKKKFNEKEKGSKRPNYGLKGFLLMVLGFLIVVLGVDMLSFFLFGLGLLIFALGGLVILYSIFRPRKRRVG